MAPAFRPGEKDSINSYPGVLTPVIDKVNKIYQGLKPRKSFISSYPRPKGRGY
jgi:hypothetical protein